MMTDPTVAAEKATGGQGAVKDGNESKAIPPKVITVDTADKGDENNAEGEKIFGQARTPKHANKTGDQKVTPDRGDPKLDKRGPPGGGNFPPPRPYEGRPLGGSGAFHPHEPRRQHPPSDYYTRSPMQVSPGGGEYSRRYYADGPGPPGHNHPSNYHPHGPPPPHPGPPHSASYYEHRGGYGEYPPRAASYDSGPPPPGYRSQYPPSSGPPPPYPPSSYPGYQSEPRGHPQGGWSTHPPPYPPSRGSQYPPGEPPYQRGPPPDHEGRYPTEHPSQSGNFSRAVSSSFDRSVKSRVDEKLPPRAPPPPAKPMPPAASKDEQDASMASDDHSWNQLKQVHSVDDSAIRERLQKADKEEEEPPEKHPRSNSSSLTNSPTDGPEHLHSRKSAEQAARAAAAAVSAVAQSSSLDSLSSVASAQAPIDTSTAKTKSTTPTTEQAPPPPSPGDSASLDLMKCSSGSSGLLHLPANQRNIEGLLFEGKRGRDEERGDANTPDANRAGGEIRRAPSDFEESRGTEEAPPQKKVRLQDKKGDSKGGEPKPSPGSITFSPSAEKAKEALAHARSKAHHGKPDYHASPQPMEGNYFDKPPSYTYSMDSAPSFPRDGGHRKQPSHPSLPPRPGSSASSTITPGAMQVDGREAQDHPSNAAVPSIPSWEIHAQDSFGNGSVGGGHGLSNSFSFQDYPMLANTDSNLGAPSGEAGSAPNPPPAQQPPHPHISSTHQPVHHPLESRNQSFDGSHYHGGGSFHRSDSMDVSYASRHVPYAESSYKQGHQGSFPPHAPSWGTQGSSGSHYQGPPPGYGSYPREYSHQGPVMRNYSQDSSHRASPPHGPPGHPRLHPSHGAPPGFQPPPEFAAPHNPHLSRRPPPNVYIMTSSQNQSQTKRGPGVFSWSKDDDMRLTEIMKKYKNPRDWEPIAKEHGCGKTAKECHERWIRYLKPGVRKGQWTDHEDAIVIEAVTTSSEQPFTRWSDLAQRLPGRVGKQIRDRWVNHLNPNINHLPFSREDDMLLWEGHKKLGKRWVEISTKCFNSSRSENHIKNRWYSASFKKFISNEFGAEAYSGTKGKKEKSSKKKSKQDSEDPTIEAI